VVQVVVEVVNVMEPEELVIHLLLVHHKVRMVE
jgi:hypothetical protein